MKLIQRTGALTVLLVFVFSIQGLFAQDKLGQTGFQFLSVGSDARAGAIANAMTSLEVGSSSLFFNPSGMARLPQTFELTASQNQWLSDINYFSLSMGFKPADGKFGTFGFSYTGVDYGKFEGTMVWGNEKGYVDTGPFYPTASAIGIGYAKALSDRFAIGAQLKYTNQYLGRSLLPNTSEDSFTLKKNLANGAAFDFGTQYITPIPGLVFGMSVRNFSQELKYEKEGFQLPLMFRIGASVDAFETFQMQSTRQNLLVSFEAVHPRSYPEYINVGVEYLLFDDLLAFRGGYSSNRDLEDYTVGFGVSHFGMDFDYSYTPFGVFDPVQRITVRLAI